MLINPLLRHSGLPGEAFVEALPARIFRGFDVDIFDPREAWALPTSFDEHRHRLVGAGRQYLHRVAVDVSDPASNAKVARSADGPGSIPDPLYPACN